jgi:hypothetical protein
MYALSETLARPLGIDNSALRHSDEMRSSEAPVREWFAWQKGMSKIPRYFPRYQTYATWNIACSVF